MVHENSDDGAMYKTPLDYREGRPLNGVMTLQNFVDGGYDVVDTKILVVVKSIGARKKGKDRLTLFCLVLLTDTECSDSQRQHHSGERQPPSPRRYRPSDSGPLGHFCTLTFRH